MPPTDTGAGHGVDLGRGRDCGGASGHHDDGCIPVTVSPLVERDIADVMHSAYLARVQAYGEMMERFQRFLDGLMGQAVERPPSTDLRT